MDWAVLKEAIRQAIIACLGVPEYDVQWINTSDAGAWRGGESNTVVDLSSTPPKSIGVDERRVDYDEETDTRTETLCGLREFTVVVQIDTETQSTDSDSTVLASQLRSRIEWPAIYEPLIAKDLSVVSVDPTTSGDILLDDRMVSRSLTPIVFVTVCNDPITLGTPSDYIDNASGASSATSEVTGSFDTRNE